MTAKEPLEERIDEILLSAVEMRFVGKDEFGGKYITVVKPEAKQALLSAFRDEQVALIERIRTEVIGEDETGRGGMLFKPARNAFRRHQRLILRIIKAEVEGKGE